MTGDRERLAEALHVERVHGAGAAVFVAERIGALAMSGDAAGVARWTAIAHALQVLAGDRDATSRH